MVVDYLSVDASDFLKRNSVFIPEIGIKVGALTEESIVRPFLCWLKRPPDEKSHYASLIDGALFEFFLHGRSKYEEARTKLTELAKSVGTATNKLNLTFDDRVASWEKDYLDYMNDHNDHDPSVET
jgi:hypothetical protein